MRRIFLDEFADNPERGEDFYRRVLLEYGDDSVAELGEAQLGIEGISNIAAKMIEDRRIGLSYLEKSSRYVSFDQKNSAGHYMYLREGSIMESRHADSYLGACDFSFETYIAGLHPLQAFLKEREPIDLLTFADSETGSGVVFGKLRLEKDIKAAERAYNTSIRAKAFDLLRGLLPASTLTNIGITGNGRAFEYLLSIMYGSDLEELKSLAGKMFEELNSVIPSFIRRANDKHGLALQGYLSETRKEVGAEAGRHLSRIAPDTNPEEVTLVGCEENRVAEIRVVAAILYEHARGHSLTDLLRHANLMSEEDRRRIISSYTKHRKNRRHRPGRAFEMVEYTFEFFTNFGMFRDLHRHRILTIERQPLSTRHGYDLPQELVEAGLDIRFRECMSRTKDAYEKIAQSMPIHAQYVVNFAYRYPYFMKLNLREACHMIELRTSPQGHPDYRRVCQEMYRKIRNVHPELSNGIRFVDMNEYRLERLDAEKKIETKKDLLR